MGNKRITSAVGSIYSTSTGIKNEIVACTFIRALLRNKGFSEQFSNQVAKYSWRNTTNRQIGAAIKQWLWFCQVKNREKFDLKLKNILDFLEYLFSEKRAKFLVLKKHKQSLVEMRKLAGMKMSLTHYNYINKFMRACFNQKPPCRKEDKTIWDVSLLLDLFNKDQPNANLPSNYLAGKAIPLIMLTTMC